jgi:phenylacetate-coenzyme A ligase PaaK-like adenylate-forming protein
MSALDMWHLFAATQRRRRKQWNSPEELAELRQRRLRRLAALAVRAPLYRQAFQRAAMTPSELTEATLDRLPILEKASLRASESA